MRIPTENECELWMAEMEMLVQVKQGIPTGTEIVNYADKRVLHDRVVSLDERMVYILDRYGLRPEHRERIRWLWRLSTLLEGRIFACLSYSPEMVAPFLGQ